MMYDGWVYIARSNTGHYKIGRSRTPVERVKHFDTIMPVEVAVVAMIPCDDYVAAEKELHRQWASVRQSGEWFDIPDQWAWQLTDIICYLDGEFIIRQEQANWGSFVNSCCLDFAMNRDAWRSAQQETS